MQTVAETTVYLHRAGKLLTAAERADVVSYLAAHPKAGDLIEGTGGVRKLRWARAAACGLSTTSMARRCRFTC